MPEETLEAGRTRLQFRRNRTQFKKEGHLFDRAAYDAIEACLKDFETNQEYWEGFGPDRSRRQAQAQRILVALEEGNFLR